MNRHACSTLLWSMADPIVGFMIRREYSEEQPLPLAFTIRFQHGEQSRVGVPDDWAEETQAVEV